MIPRRNRELPFGRNSSLFSYKRRYNGNLCARSVQQAKAASSMMICTLSAPTAYFLSTTVLCARNVSATAYFLPTAAKSMKKCRQKPSVSAGVLWRLSFAIERKLPVGDKIRLLPQRYAAGGNKISNCKNIPRRRPKQHKNTPPRRMTQPGRQREGKRAFFKRCRALSRPHASGSPRPPP